MVAKRLIRAENVRQDPGDQFQTGNIQGPPEPVRETGLQADTSVKVCLRRISASGIAFSCFCLLLLRSSDRLSRDGLERNALNKICIGKPGVCAKTGLKLSRSCIHLVSLSASDRSSEDVRRPGFKSQ